jgi:hypothetical protein
MRLLILYSVLSSLLPLRSGRREMTRMSVLSSNAPSAPPLGPVSCAVPCVRACNGRRS